MNPHRLIIFTSLLAAIVCLPFSVVGCHTAIGIFLVAWCMEGRWGTKWSIFANNSLIWIFLVFFIIHISGLFNSDNIDQAWFNLEKKITLLILPLTLSTTLSLQKSDIAMLIKGFVAGCLVAAGSCVLMAMNHYPGERQINFDSHTLFSYSLQNPDSSQTWMNLSYISLASGIDMHPTFLAYYILFAACILYEGLEDQKSGWLTPLTSFLLIIFFCSLIFLLSSRLVIFLTLLAAATVLSLYLKQASSYRLWVGAAIPVLFAVGISLNPVMRYRSWQELLDPQSYHAYDGEYHFSTGLRYSLWKVATYAIGEVNPITGTGTGDVAEAMKQEASRQEVRHSIGTNDPHNEYLFLQLALGTPGLLMWILCLTLPLIKAWKQNDMIFFFFFLSFAALCVTESAFESQKGIVLFTLFSSLFIFKYRFTPELGPGLI